MTRRRWLAVGAGGLTVALRTATAAADTRFDRLADGMTLAGWTAIGAKPGTWRVDDGAITASGPGKSWLSTNRPFRDFDLRLSFRVGPGGNSGVLLRSPHAGDPSFEGVEVQILDDAHPGYRLLRPDQYAGSVYGLAPARAGASRPAGEWNRLAIRLIGPAIKVELNGVVVVSARLNAIKSLDGRSHPGASRPEGFIGLQHHETPVWVRDLAIRAIA